MDTNGMKTPPNDLYEDIPAGDEPTLSSPDSTPVYGDTPTDPANEFPQDPNYQDPYVVQNEEEREKIRLELAQTEEDIAALRSTLRGKEQAAKELKRKLGITTMSEVKKDVAQGWKNIQQSNAYVNTSNKLHEINERITTSSAYQRSSFRIKKWNSNVKSSKAYNKTKTGLSTAGQKTGAAFSTLGSSISKKLGEMKESTAFKSFESKVSNASGNIKNKLTGSKSEDLSTFEETLNTTVKEEQVNADGSSTKTDSGTPLPEEKVPL
ncbi:tumor protein D54-like isoform X4 [Anneissia japonica]|uniref:tumor protein D54-like isoform X4 n=1 Tax=Anneissia japonica TaxID=1529436 RepID=UPI001425B3F7|nr:tumor protein D54-like isoform X4 [Anneissia japonica]